MRKNFGPKAWMFPQPVQIISTYNEDGSADAMNAGWGGIIDYDKIILDLEESHRTVANMLNRKAFCVSVGTKDTVVACDYVGMVSGNKDAKKMEKSGFTTVKSEFVDAPIINELPFTLECELLSFDSETGQALGKIVNISCEEECLSNGVPDYHLIKPLIFDPMRMEYVGFGEKEGNAFKDGAKLND